MFGRKKMYKKGLADAMKAYEAFGEKQEAAIAKIRQEVKDGQKTLETAIKNLGEDIFAVYDYLEKHEKEVLYKLCTPMDLKEFEDSERRLLLAVLCQLAVDEGSKYTPNQRKFINSVKKYLEISNIQDNIPDYAVIGEIDSLDVQETIMRVCLEFMYLQDSDEMSDEQESFFDNFAVNKRKSKLIEFEVIRQFHLFGEEGMAEKYGSGDGEIPELCEDEPETVSAQISEKPEPYNGIPLEIAEKACDKKLGLLNRFNDSSIFETKDYLVYFKEDTINIKNSRWYRLGKNDNSSYSLDSLNSDYETRNVFQRSYGDTSSRIHGLWKSYCISYHENTAYFFINGTLHKLDVDNDVLQIVSQIRIEEEIESVCYDNSKLVVSTYENLYIVDLTIESLTIIKDAVGKNIGRTAGMVAIDLDTVIFISNKGRELTADDGGSIYDWICAYSIKHKTLTRIVNLKNFPKSPSYFSALFIVHKKIYVVCEWRFDKFLFYNLAYDGKVCNIENIIDYPFGCQLQLYYNFLAYYNDNGQTFPIYVYDFDKETNQKVINGCKTFVNEGVFKVKLKDEKTSFKMIGQWLYSIHGWFDLTTNEIGNDICRVNVNIPMDFVRIKMH